MEVAHIKIKSCGDITIPKNILEMLGIKGGDEVEINIEEQGIFIKSTKSVVDELSGLIKVKSETVDEVMENEELYEF